MNDLSANAQRLLLLFERMRHRHSSPVFQQLTALNLSFSHMRLLTALVPDRTLAMKELAEHLGMTPPSVTALTRRLSQAGLIARRAHPSDSRVTLLELTAAGRELHRQLYEDQIERMRELLSGLNPSDQALFLDLLERAVAAMFAGHQPDALPGQSLCNQPEK